MFDQLAVGFLVANDDTPVSYTHLDVYKRQATNTCEVYPNGNVSCSQTPYALSPIQLTLFPLLAHNFFKGLSANGKSSWQRSYHVKAAIVPGASGFAGQPYTWNCNYSLHGQGPIANAGALILVTAQGTLDQQLSLIHI